MVLSLLWGMVQDAMLKLQVMRDVFVLPASIDFSRISRWST